MQTSDSIQPAGSHEAYGVTERLNGGDPTDEAVAELSVNGYTIIPSSFPADFLGSLASALDRAYAQQVAEIGGESVLHAMHDADIARCMLAYAPLFLEAAIAPPLMKLAARVLGNEFLLLMQNGIINRPERENYQSKWHRDLNYQHWTSSKPLAINALLCIDEFTVENGATFVLPGTHHLAEFPTAAFTGSFERQIQAPAGSFLVLDAMLFHRGGANRTSHMRRAVNHVIGRPFMAQQIDLPSALASAGVTPPDNPAVKKYLGYRWSPARDVTDWRSRRAMT